MSAIGDYIHYNASNYTLKGINRRDAENADWSYASAKAKYALSVKNFALSKDAEKLSEILNSIFSKAAKKNQNDNTIYDKAFKLLEAHLDKEWADAHTLIGKLTTSGNVSLTDAQKELVNQLHKIEKLSDKTQRTFEKTINTRLDLCISNIKNRASSGLISQAEAERIQKDIANLQKLVKIEAQKSPLIEAKAILIDPKDPNSSLFNKINEVIEASNYTSTINSQKGEIFEYAVALAMYILELQAQKAVDEVILDSLDNLIQGATLNQITSGIVLTGATTSNVELNLKNFDANIGKALKASNMHNYKLNKEGSIFVSTLASQNKVDIAINMEKYKANISAKNYNFQFANKTGRGIRILEKASMLTLLQDEDSNLVNHYLNIIATRPKQQHMLETRKGVFIKKIREEIKALLLFKALSGNQQGTLNNADYFIVNDNTSTGKNSIKVYDINTIFNKCVSNLDKVKFTINDNIPLDALQLKNVHIRANGGSYEAADIRIANILQDLHNKKISVALSTDLLT